MRIGLSRVWPLGLALATIGAAVAAAGAAQTQPGLPTKPSVWVENRGIEQAVPITVERVAAPINVQVVGVPTFTVNPATVLATRLVRQSWEYRTVVIKPGSDAAAELNAAGQEGWEAVSVASVGQQGAAMILKRPR